MGLSAQGGAAIVELFGALVPVAPDGLGVKLTHVVGNELGGGFEWISAPAAPGAVLRGATAIELAGGLITRMAVYFDSRLMDEGQKGRRGACHCIPKDSVSVVENPLRPIQHTPFPAQHQASASSTVAFIRPS